MLNYFKYKHLAYWDLLCNCNNRNFLEDKLIKKYANKSTYITMIDIDYFKNVNDILGHLAGDNILHSLVDLLNNEANIKYICRYGGDEFIILHEKPIDFTIHNELFTNLYKVSFSFGTLYKEKYDKMFDVLIEVDKLLYKQKTTRR